MACEIGADGHRLGELLGGRQYAVDWDISYISSLHFRSPKFSASRGWRLLRRPSTVVYGGGENFSEAEMALDETVLVRVDHGTKDYLKKMATEADRSVSWVIQRAIAAAIAADKTQRQISPAD